MTSKSRDERLRLERDQRRPRRELLLQLLFRRKEEALAHDVVVRVEQLIHGLKAEIRHPDPVRVGKCERHAQPIGVRLADVADFLREGRLCALLSAARSSWMLNDTIPAAGCSTCVADARVFRGYISVYHPTLSRRRNAGTSNADSASRSISPRHPCRPIRPPSRPPVRRRCRPEISAGLLAIDRRPDVHGGRRRTGASDLLFQM